MEQQGAAALADRLRALRRERWPDRRLTQQEVANALGVSLASVSAWESVKSPTPVPANRLAAYARFFATKRSVGGAAPQLLAEDQLTEPEIEEYDRLAAELRQLRALAVGEIREQVAMADGPPRSMWHFPDGGPVRLICGKRDDPPDYASVQDHNYLELSAYQDVDALVDLFGHVRARNPDSNVGFDVAPGLESDDLRSHLVLLGSGVVNNAAARIANMIDLPVRQVDGADIKDGEIFESVDDPSERFVPKFVGDDPEAPVLEDVGLFYRTPNPNNVDRTLTICSGVFSRGVYGSVRFLTDDGLRHENEAYLAERFGETPTFGLLMRVPVFGHATSTPDLRHPGAVLKTWPEVAA